MKITKTGEAQKTVTAQSACSQSEIIAVLEMLKSDFKKMSPFYFFKNPAFIFKNIDYAVFIIKSDHVYMRRSVTTPPFFIYFKMQPSGQTILSFEVSYLPVFRWAFYISIPMMLYFVYDFIKSDQRTSSILVSIAFGSFICGCIFAIAFIHKSLVCVLTDQAQSFLEKQNCIFSNTTSRVTAFCG